MITTFSFDDLEYLGSSYIENKNSSYYFEGKRVPRVTEIISKMIEEKSIILWANSLGFEGRDYQKVLDYYADLGTRTHNGIECFLRGEKIPSDTPYFPYTSFMNWWTAFNKIHKTEIMYIEEPLISPYCGGTLDFLLKVDDKVYLIDFKTSRHITYKYFLQLAAYRMMLRDYKEINVDCTMILQVSKDKLQYKEYIYDLSIEENKKNMDIYERTFMSLVYAYTHITYLEEQFTQYWT